MSSLTAKLDELEELRKRATPGEWKCDKRGGSTWVSTVRAPRDGTSLPITVCRVNGVTNVFDITPKRREQYFANACLIPAAVNALPALIAVAREADYLANVAPGCEAKTRYLAARSNLLRALKALRVETE